MVIPEQKCEYIAMDFVVGLPPTAGGFNSILVVMDHLTKSAYFILVKVKYTVERLAQLSIS